MTTLNQLVKQRLKASLLKIIKDNSSNQEQEKQVYLMLKQILQEWF